jgi:Cu/Ag efflux protein CusF
MVSRRWVALGFASAVVGQQKGGAKKSFVLTGKVDEVDAKGGRLTVNHDKIEGYMAAMTMPYKVDKAEVFERVKAGDQIRATVYEDDYTLYDVRVVSAGSSKKKK